MRKKYKFLLALAILSFVFASVTTAFLYFKSDTQAQASINNFQLYVSAENSESVSTGIRSSILDTLNNRWIEEFPPDNTFYMPSIRLEENWGLANLHYKSAGVNYADEENSPISNSFTMLITKNLDGQWLSAFTDEPLAADLVRFIPSDELSEEAKTTLVAHYPSSYKTMSFNVNYKLPWRSNGPKFFFSGVRVNNTYPCSNNSGWHGALPYLGGQPCHALDFAPRLSSTVTNADIVSPVTGYIEHICKNSGGLKQSALAIKATSSNQLIGIWHLDKNTIPAGLKQGVQVKQGDYLGQMVTGFVDESKAACPLISQGTHLHLVAPYKPFAIDGYTFTQDSKVQYGSNTYTMSAFQGTDLVSTNGGSSSTNTGGCLPPSTGDWVVSQDCKLSSSAKVARNLIISDGKTLTIDNNMTLDLNLKDYKILVKPNAKLIIKSGSKIF
jgi:hypothetical protein